MTTSSDKRAIDQLASMWSWGRVVVLTGAGVSTNSGIPDYRGQGSRARLARTGGKQIQHTEFVSSPEIRQRYWARSFRGWQTIGEAKPNRSHQILAELEDCGAISGLITQNVDRLHRRAGSKNVVELHGALADVVCLECGQRIDRTALQDALGDANPNFRSRAFNGELRPDGDHEIDPAAIAAFKVIDCVNCSGPLKPDVVFFGGTVPKSVLAAAWALFEPADTLLVVGSSLTVYSGFRFVRRADKERMPVAIINRGETRGDPLATIKIDEEAGQTLAELARLLRRPPLESDPLGVY